MAATPSLATPLLWSSMTASSGMPSIAALGVDLVDGLLDGLAHHLAVPVGLAAHRQDGADLEDSRDPSAAPGPGRCRRRPARRPPAMRALSVSSVILPCCAVRRGSGSAFVFFGGGAPAGIPDTTNTSSCSNGCAVTMRAATRRRRSAGWQGAAERRVRSTAIPALARNAARHRRARRHCRTIRRKRVLIAGASGTVGQAAVHHFEALGDWASSRVSRRPVEHAGTGRVRHLALDLMDAEGVPRGGLRPPVGHACRLRRALRKAGPGRGLARSGADDDQPRYAAKPSGSAERPRRVWPMSPSCRARRPMACTSARSGFRRASAGRATRTTTSTGCRKTSYASRRHGADFAFTILRPQVVFGDVAGVAMNLIPVIRRLCRNPPRGGEAVLLSRRAALSARGSRRAAHGQGARLGCPDPRPQRARPSTSRMATCFVWQNVWSAIAEALGVVPGEPEPQSMAEVLQQKEQTWARIVERHNLRPLTLAALLGLSHQYADFCFAYGAKRAPAPTLVSTIKLRQAGFHDCIDTEVMFRELISSLVSKRLIPRYWGDPPALE